MTGIITENVTHNEVKPKGPVPDFKGDGVAVWVHTDKNNKQFLSIKALQGSINFLAFKNEPKKEKKED